MRRREFIAGLGSAAAWPLAARAQQRMPTVGLLSGISFEAYAKESVGATAFYKGLAETGFFAGRNVAFERRSAEEDYQRLPDLAADLVRRQVDVIVASETAPALAAKAATRTIPIVFITGADPVQIIVSTGPVATSPGWRLLLAK